MSTSLHEFKVKNAQGQETDLGQFKGKAVLVVNVASKCGFTPQYEGLEKLYRQHHAIIRAVVLDVIMPGMGGGATFRAMREINRDVAVLLMSGYTMNEDVQGLLTTGAAGFVMKPYSVEVLARSLANVMSAVPAR